MRRGGANLAREVLLQGELVIGRIQGVATSRNRVAAFGKKGRGVLEVGVEEGNHAKNMFLPLSVALDLSFTRPAVDEGEREEREHQDNHYRLEAVKAARKTEATPRRWGGWLLRGVRVGVTVGGNFVVIHRAEWLFGELPARVGVDLIEAVAERDEEHTEGVEEPGDLQDENQGYRSARDNALVEKIIRLGNREDFLLGVEEEPDRAEVNGCRQPDCQREE